MGKTTKGIPRPTGAKVSEAEFRRMWLDPRISTREIGERLGISYQAVSHRAKVRGLPPRKGANVTARKRAIECDAFAAMWRANVSLADLTRHFGCCHVTISNTARRMGLGPRSANRWNTITLSDFWSAPLREALAERAREEQAALRLAEMVDGAQPGRWPARRAA